MKKSISKCIAIFYIFCILLAVCSIAYYIFVIPHNTDLLKSKYNYTDVVLNNNSSYMYGTRIICYGKSKITAFNISSNVTMIYANSTTKVKYIVCCNKTKNYSIAIFGDNGFYKVYKNHHNCVFIKSFGGRVIIIIYK